MIEALSYEFIQRSLAAGLVLSLIAPLIGSFLVAQRYSLMADTLAHVSLFGVALGLLFDVNPLLSSLVVSLGAAWAIEGLRANQRSSADSLLAIFLWAGLSGAVVLISLSQGFTLNLFSYLFGDIAAVRPSELGAICGLGSLVLVVFWGFRKEFFALALDQELAQASGISAKKYNRLLVLLAATTVALASKVMGVLLIGALMVIPFTAAVNFNRSFKDSLLISLVISILSMLFGLALSFQFDLAPGGAIVLCALAAYLVSLLCRPR